MKPTSRSISDTNSSFIQIIFSHAKNILTSSISHPHKKHIFQERGEKRSVNHHLENFHHVFSSWLLASLIGIYSFLGTSFLMESYAASPPTVPPQVLNFRGIPMTGSVLLAWKSIPPSSTYPRVVDYIVEYKLSTKSLFRIFPDGVGTGTYAKVKNLLPGKTYDFRVRAKNKIGLGDYSKKLRITLPSLTSVTSTSNVSSPGALTTTSVTTSTGNSLSGSQEPTPVDGVCGTSHRQTVSTLPTDLCTTGTASLITSASFSYIWSCAGMAGGITLTCTAYITSASTYSWVVGAYGSCSLECGGGMQNRTVTCVRNDGVTVADSYCTPTKPATSQSCNTEACTTPIHGICGPFDGQTLATPPSLTPTSNFCTMGLTSAVASGPSSYTWTCAGTNGGTTVSCSANK